MVQHFTFFMLFLLITAFSQHDDRQVSLIVEGEKHLSHIRQLTFGGENAEGYFSFDETKLIFQSTTTPYKCDQEFVLDLATGNAKLVSTGTGRTTCGYFLPGDKTILFSSTHHYSDDCPTAPDHSQGYAWKVSPEYDIFLADVDGSNLRQLTTTPGYDAEATVSPLGDRIVFTSTRNGDLNLFTMNLDGTDVLQLTHELGYDGGAFYSWDGKMIVYRSWHHTDSAQIATYKRLLEQNLVRPSRMELFVMNADGSNKRQISNNGAANFAPFFHPDNKRIIFASNMENPKGRNFDLYLINVDGTGIERVTFNATFDGFPMFSRDGRKLVFASNRNGKVQGETNLFIADWKE
ncbi:MAG: PD40 domain-containing protein [Ignavibacteriae bacterium]|nr:PD40 domain-containing protein [Ignavibacteriota bacterium]